MTFFQKLKQKVWYSLYPVWPRIEHSLLFLHGNKRQKFKVGWLAPNHTLQGLKKHLSSQWGFGNHFVAWEDSSQVLSWRKLENFREQYHLRVYADGEIRGHFEYTPEAAPVAHLMKSHQVPATKDFLKFLGPFVTTKKHIRHLNPAEFAAYHEPEVTFAK